MGEAVGEAVGDGLGLEVGFGVGAGVGVGVAVGAAVGVGVGVAALTVTDVAVEFADAPVASVTWIMKFHLPVAVEVEVTKL